MKKTKRQYRRTHSVSAEAHLLLCMMAKRKGMSRSGLLEQLIRRAARSMGIEVTDAELAEWKRGVREKQDAPKPDTMTEFFDSGPAVRMW